MRWSRASAIILSMNAFACGYPPASGPASSCRDHSLSLVLALTTPASARTPRPSLMCHCSAAASCRVRRCRMPSKSSLDLASATHWCSRESRTVRASYAGDDGVEHVYSQTVDDRVMVTARFLVGTRSDDAIVRVHEKIRANLDRIPVGIAEPLIVGRGINDVAA